MKKLSSENFNLLRKDKNIFSTLTEKFDISDSKDSKESILNNWRWGGFIH